MVDDNKQLTRCDSFNAMAQFEYEVADDSPFGQALAAQDKMNPRGNKRNLIGGHIYVKKQKDLNEITREHEMYNLTYSMMVGMRHVIAYSDSQNNNSRNSGVSKRNNRVEVDPSIFKDRVRAEGGVPPWRQPRH